MRRIFVVSVAASLLSTACMAPSASSAKTSGPSATAEPTNGLPVGAAVPSFMPYHLTGANSGKQACPLCIYGNKPQIQIWTRESELDSAISLALKLETGLAGSAQPYLVIVPSKPGEVGALTLSKLAKSGLKDTFATHVPSLGYKETSGLYNHLDWKTGGLRVYCAINRRLFARWDGASERTSGEILAKTRAGLRFVAGYDLTDRQIAPAWEPGQKFTVSFEVFDKSGSPVKGAKVTAWQTDQSGLYNPREFGHIAPRLQATAWTDANGKIEFETIYPGPYPDQPEPSHIHFAIPVDGKSQWRTLWFEGDPRLTAQKRQWEADNEETVTIPVDKSGPTWTAYHRFVVQ